MIKRCAFIVSAVAVLYAQPTAAQATFPDTTVMRAKFPSGRWIYGCGTNRSGTLSIRRRTTSSEQFSHKDCGRDSLMIRIDSIKEIQIPERVHNYGISSVKGAIIGAAVAGAGVWTLRRPKAHTWGEINTPADWIALGAIAGAAAGVAWDRAHGATEWIPLSSSGSGGTNRQTVREWFLGRAKLEATAGAGFAGIRVAEVLATDSNSTSNTYQPVKNSRFDWRPAISTGIVTYVYTTKASNLGAGLGVQIVSLPTTEGKAFPFPAITLHLGTPQTEFFAGLVLSPTDSISLPRENGVVTRQPYSKSPTSFVHRGTNRSQHLYIGIQIKGTRKGSGEIGVPDKTTLEMDVQESSVKPGDSLHLWAHMEDSLGNVVATGPAKFEVVHGNAKIEDNWLKTDTTSIGIVVIRASLGGKEKFKSIEVKNP